MNRRRIILPVLAGIAVLGLAFVAVKRLGKASVTGPEQNAPPVTPPKGPAATAPVPPVAEPLPQTAREAFEVLAKTEISTEGVLRVLSRYWDRTPESTAQLLRDLPPSDAIAVGVANAVGRWAITAYANDPVTQVYALLSKGPDGAPQPVREQIMFWTVIHAVEKSPVEALQAFTRLVEAHGADDPALPAAAESITGNYGSMSPLPPEAAGRWKAAFDEWAHSKSAPVWQLAFSGATAKIARDEGFFGDFVATASAIESAGNAGPMRFVADYMVEQRLDPAEHIAEGVLTPERKAELEKTYEQRAAAKARALEAGKARAMEQPPK